MGQRIGGSTPSPQRDQDHVSDTDNPPRHGAVDHRGPVSASVVSASVTCEQHIARARAAGHDVPYQSEMASRLRNTDPPAPSTRSAGADDPHRWRWLRNPPPARYGAGTRSHRHPCPFQRQGCSASPTGTGAEFRPAGVGASEKRLTYASLTRGGRAIGISSFIDGCTDM